MTYKICEWEVNGYHDSDFMAAYFDDADNKVHSIEIGSTRYASGPYPDVWANAANPTKDVVEKARQWLQEHIYRVIREAEHIDVTTPSIRLLIDGTEVRLLVPHNSIAKQIHESKSPCLKCNGSGKWVNPRNETDARPCFTCNGTGEYVTKTKETLKNDDGKQVRNKLPEGTIGTVLSQKSYGTFYRKGYNHPDRSNTTCQVKLQDGSIVPIPAEKLRLNKEPMSDQELMERAKNLSYNYNWTPAVGCKAWLSCDYTFSVHHPNYG
jgi:hypothetical protein